MENKKKTFSWAINRKGKGNHTTIALAVLLTVVILAAVSGALMYFNVINVTASTINGGLITNPITQPSGSNPLISVNRPVPFITTNALNGSIVVTTTITILSPSGATLETLTSDGTTAKVTTSNPYPSGTQLIIEIAKAGYDTQEFTFTVPQMSQSDTYGTTNNYQVNIPIYGAGVYTMVLTDSGGTAYTNASSTYNWTAKGTTSDTFTLTIYSTANYEGWRDSHDIVNNVDWNFLIAGTDNSTHLSLTGAPNVVNWGGTLNWLWQVPQDQTLRVVQGNAVQKAGVTTISFTVNKGSFSSGCEMITFTPEFYASVSQFSNTGAYGPSAAAGSVFELLFIK
jgi:flagellar basal body-associated protein FliL